MAKAPSNALDDFPQELLEFLLECAKTVPVETGLARLKAMRIGQHAGGQTTVGGILKAQHLVAKDLAESAAHWFGPALVASWLRMVAEHEGPSRAAETEWRKSTAADIGWIKERLSPDDTAPGGEASHCLLPRYARYRYHHEYCIEKRLIAKRVAHSLFSRDGVRCFLQASTFISHLADEIKRQRVADCGLFHTNSACFASALLSGSQSTCQVFPVAGQLFDDLCQGWYLANDAVDAKKYLKDLLRRDHDPLEFALLTPQYMTADGCLHFLRFREAGNFARLVASNARNLVIVSPAGRIFPDVPSLEEACGHEIRSEVTLTEVLDSRREAGENVDVQVLVCGAFRDGLNPAAFENVVRDRLGASYAYCPLESAGWQVDGAPA